MSADNFQKLEIGQRVIWSKGVAGQVLGIDTNDCMIMDECGGWWPYADVELAEIGA